MIAKKFAPAVTEWIGAVRLQSMQDWAADAVRWANDFMKAHPGEEKRKAVLEALYEIRDRKDWDITDQQIDILVRAAYVAMKAEEREVFVIGTDAD